MKSRHIQVYLLILSLFFVSCANKKRSYNYIELELLETKHIRIDEHVKAPSNIHYSSLGDSSVWIDNYRANTLIRLDKDFQPQKTIPAFFYLSQYLIDFRELGPDSILIVLNAARFANYAHDSTVFLINSRGEPYRNYSLLNFPVLLDAKETDLETTTYIHTGGNKSFIGGDYAYFELTSYRCEVAMSCFEEQRKATVARINLHSGETEILPLFAPQVPREISGLGVLSPNYSKGSLAFWEQKPKNIYMAWPYSPWIMSYDVENKKRDSLNIASVLLDSLRFTVYADKRSRTHLDYAQSAYEKVLHYRENLYLRTWRPAVDKAELVHYLKGKKLPRKAFVLFDAETGKILGEGVVPKGRILRYLLTTADGSFWVWNRIASQEQKEMILERYRFKKENMKSKQALAKRISEQLAKED